jgi:hypothetical protein
MQDKRADDGQGGKPMRARAAYLISMLRQVIIFGAAVLPEKSGCDKVRAIFGKIAELRMIRGNARST